MGAKLFKNSNLFRVFLGGMLILVSLIFSTSKAEAAITKEINYQGRMTNLSDVNVPDTSYSIIFRIYDASSGGTCLWSARGTCGTPTARSVTTSGGIFSIGLGDTVAGDNAINLEWDTTYYLSVKVGADSEMSPRKKISAGGYAFNANNLIGDGRIGIGNTSPSNDALNISYNPTSGTFDAADITYGVGGGTGNALQITQLGSGNAFLVNDETNDTSPFIIKNDGNVGIGTTAPGEKLDVVGNIKLAGSSASASYSLKYFDTGGEEWYSQYAYGGLNFGETGQADGRLFLKDGGNVGIGTTNPGAKLEVSSGSFDQFILRRTTASAGTMFKMINGDNNEAVIQWGGNESLTFETLNTERVRIQSDGNVGIGTTNPSQKLHVEGQCVTGDTLLSIISPEIASNGQSAGIDASHPEQSANAEEVNDREETSAHITNSTENAKIPQTRDIETSQNRDMTTMRIDAVKGGELVLSLDEKTGKLVPAKIKGLLDMGVKPIFKITTADGRTIRTTGEHPYLAKEKNNHSSTQKENSSKSVISLPLKSEAEVSFCNNPSSAQERLANVGGVTRNKIIPENLPGGNKLELAKSLSWVKMILDSALAKSPNSKSDEPLGTNLTSCPLLMSNLASLNLTFSSTRNFMEFFCGYLNTAPLSHASGIAQSRLDMLFGERREILEQFVNCFAGSEHCQNLPNHNASALESGLPVTDGGVGNDVFIEGDNHKNSVNNYIASDYSNKNQFSSNEGENNTSATELESATWTKVMELSAGQEIAVPDEENVGVQFVKIAKIEQLPSEQVYDIEVEGTHNFVANGIIAHNTYISSNVGIGTTNPLNKLHVEGTGAGAAGIYLNNAAPGTTTSTLYNSGGALYWSGTALATGGISNGTITGQTIYWNGSAWTANVNLFNNNTNVGIGTTAPAQLFQVNSSATASLVVTSAGQVGIGTTAPDTKLKIDLGEVSIRPNGGNIMKFESYTGSITKGAFRFSDNSGTIFQLIGDNGADLSLRTYNGSAYKDNLYIDASSESVGIGTTAPAYKLDLAGSVNDYLQRIYNTNTGASAGGLYVRGDGLGNLLTLNYAGSDIMTVNSAQTTFSNPVNFATTGDVAFANDLLLTNGTAGNILFQSPGYIKTDSVWQNLDLTLSAAGTGEVIVDDNLKIVGSIKANFSASTWGYASITGTTAGTISYYSSDRRLKTNIDYLDSAIDVVRQLKPANYNIIADGSYTSGFIAQDTLGLVPGAASLMPDGYYAFNVNGIVAYATKAVQELDSRTRFLENRFVSSADPAMLVNEIGNVGIGTTNPTEKLTVAGNINLMGGSFIDDGVDISALIFGLQNSSGAQELEMQKLSAELSALKLDRADKDLLAQQKMDTLQNNLDFGGSQINLLGEKLSAVSQKLSQNFQAELELPFYQFASVSSELSATLTDGTVSEGQFLGTYSSPENFQEVALNLESANQADLSDKDLAESYLVYDVFISDPNTIEDYRTELGNTQDQKEIEWEKTAHPFFLSGWNEVRLSLNEGAKSGEIDWESVGYFRAYFKFRSTTEMKFKNIRIVTKEAYRPLAEVVGSENLDLWNNVDQGTALKNIFAELKTQKETAVEADKQLDKLTGDLAEMQSQLALFQEQSQAVVDLALAMDLGNVLYKDENGSVLGLSIVQAEEVEAVTVQAQNYVVSEKGDPLKNNVGSVIIKTGEQEVLIKNEDVTIDSKIIVTPVGSSPVFWVISDKINGVGFKIKLDKPAEFDIAFDYWVIRVEK